MFVQNWDEVEANVTSRYDITYRSEYLVMFELPNGQKAMIQEAEAGGFDYETLRVDAGGFDDELDSAYRVLTEVSITSNGLFTVEEVVAHLYVRHMIPTLVLNGPMLDGFMGALGSVAANIKAKQAAGQLRPQPH